MVAMGILSVKTTALLRGLFGTRQEEVLGFAVEPFHTHVDVASQICMCKVHMPFQGVGETVGVNWRSATVRGSVLAGAIRIQGDRTPIDGSRRRLDKVEARAPSLFLR